MLNFLFFNESEVKIIEKFWVRKQTAKADLCIYVAQQMRLHI